jgi:hypothetical protein
MQSFVVQVFMIVLRALTDVSCPEKHAIFYVMSWNLQADNRSLHSDYLASATFHPLEQAFYGTFLIPGDAYVSCDHIGCAPFQDNKLGDNLGVLIWKSFQ